MPWCDECSRFFTPPSMGADGSCPSCGRVLVDPAAASSSEEAVPKAPWHFKLLVAAVAIYLAWRVIQVIGWIVS